VITLANAVVQFTEQGCVTTFADGASWGALPHDTPHYHVIAHRCGYGDDLLSYCREHEICHLVVEECLHDRPSRILWGLAHGEPIGPAEAAYEEMAAQTLQRFIRAAERPIIGGIDWDGIRDFALTKLGASYAKAT
jgi:hypothetical protein